MGKYISPECAATLEAARATYGHNNQILVAIEELNELASVLAKFGRYDNTTQAVAKTRDKVLDEVADVFVVLNHVISIYGIDDSEIAEHCALKVARVKAWLKKSDSMVQTTIDRELKPISSSRHYAGFEDQVTAKLCEGVAQGIETIPHLNTTKTCSNCWFFYHGAEAPYGCCPERNYMPGGCQHWCSSAQ